MSPSPLHLISLSRYIACLFRSLFLSQSLFQANTFKTPAITSYHWKTVIKTVWDNIWVFLAHTHHSLSPLVSVLSCSHTHLSSWLFLSFFSFPTTHFFPSLLLIFFNSLIPFGLSFSHKKHYSWVKNITPLSLRFVFSLTPKWFPPEFLDQHFIPVRCSVPFCEGAGVGLKCQSHNPSLWGLGVAKGDFVIGGLSFKNYFLRLQSWVSTGSPLERKVLMDSVHFRTLSYQQTGIGECRVTHSDMHKLSTTRLKHKAQYWSITAPHSELTYTFL